MKSQSTSDTIRRSIALPRNLIENVQAAAPPELRQNFNRLVTVALREFVTRQRQRSFQEAMALMAADPQITAECAAIESDFTGAEQDGLPDD
ncbi:MAG: hypothetical protein V2B19_22265 [Pseudomonadota bacterium]